MDTQDKLFQKIKSAAHKNTGEKDFPAMEKVWQRVEEKLDHKENKRTVLLWQKVALVASLLLFVSIGYQFLKNEKEIVQPVQPSTLEIPVPIVQNETDVPKQEEKAIPEQQPSLKKENRRLPLQKAAHNDIAVVSKEDSATEKTVLPTVVSSKEVSQEAVAGIYKDGLKNSYNNSASVMESSSLVAAKRAVTAVSKEVISDETLPKNVVVNINSSIDNVTGEKTIKGVVTENSFPLPGVNVTIKGTKRSTQTDIDGRFTVKVNPYEILEFSFIGMKTQSIVFTNQKQLLVAMEEDAQLLSEVVVVTNSGYNKKEARGANKSIVTVRPNIAGMNISQGKLNSSTITQNFLDNVKIRGVKSETIPNDPLVIVNGKVVPYTDLQSIDPKKIAHLQVLQNNLATALYGEKAKNGVLIVKTKKLTRKERKQWESLMKELENNNTVPDAGYDLHNEEYEEYYENVFESPRTSPLSTFSIDVDNASYTNIRRMINNGQKVPKNAVRIEEMINFFKYAYPEPKSAHPFSITTTYSDAPWNPNTKLVRIGLQGKTINSDMLPASNLVFLIDVSGSMDQNNKLPLLKESMKILIQQLREQDKVAIVVYAGAAGVVLPPTSGNQKAVIMNALENLSAGGSTAGGAGIELAYKIAEDNFIVKGNNRVILATDGDFNTGASSDNAMQQLIEEKRKTGVFLTCLGFGMGNYKDSKMETLANKGNGNYAYIDTMQEANRFLGKEFKGSMFTIAKDVKIQVEFNPALVQAYRLIGYENRKLRPEDFENDTIDAGELGVGHQVTALYEIIPTGITSPYFKAAGLKYTPNTITTTFNDELATIKFRYKRPDGNKSIVMEQIISNSTVAFNKTDPDFKFCTAVAWSGLILRQSELITGKNLNAVKELAQEGIVTDTEGYRSEFIRLLENLKTE